MSAIETAQSGPNAADPPAGPNGAGDPTAWLLDGCWFTVDPHGAVTAWSPAAAALFGWPRAEVAGQLFAERIVAEASRPAAEAAVAEALAEGASGRAASTGELDVRDSGGRALRAEFALVPIQLNVGYEFNALLTDISSRAGREASLTQLKAKHEAVMDVIESALAGRPPAPAGEGSVRIAGALVLFHSERGAAARKAPDNVVPIDAAGGDDAHGASRQDLEEARAEARAADAHVEEARREAQRSHTDAEVARQEANDARDALVVSQREADDARRQLVDARRAVEEAQAVTEEFRIRSEELHREAERLRGELREARTAMRSSVEEADAELIHARQEADWASSEAAEAKAEAARHAAEVEALRGKLQTTQRDLGIVRGELEAVRAERAQGAAISERRGSEAERLRAELDAARQTAAADRYDAEAARTELEAARREGEELRAELERRSAAEPAEGDDLRAAFHGAPVATALLAPDGRVVDVNAAFCAALGLDHDRLVSGDAPVVVHPDDVDSRRALVARMLAGEQSVAHVYRRWLHSDGHAITMRESMALLRDGDEQPQLFVLQLEDADADAHAEALVVDADVAAEELDGPSEEAIRRALDEGLFELHAQPVLDLRSGATSQYELLIRMVGDDGRMVMPQAFLGPARRAGLAHAIDRWVVREAVATLARIPADVRLEVNLSPEAVTDPELTTVIDQELATTGVDPARLILEVTGQTAVEAAEATRTLAGRVRALGCRFALDDFRSTFGSFRILKDLPLDYLKLDGELVGSLAESRTSQLIVKALVDVARATGTYTVAVFVSDEETIATLRQQGVDYAQGYRVGRPQPVHDVWPAVAPVPALPAGAAY